MELRKINALEVNKKIESLPNGIFGYSYGHTISSISKRYNNDYSQLNIQKRNPSDSERRLFFEIRKHNHNDIRLIGYVSDESLLTYNKAKGFLEKETVVFPIIHDLFKNNIEIQIQNQPLQIHNRDIEDDESVNISILEIKEKVTNDKIPENLEKVPHPGLLVNVTTENYSGNGTVSPLNLHQKNNQGFVERVTNNQTVAVVLGGLCLLFIVYMIYYRFGLNLSDFK